MATAATAKLVFGKTTMCSVELPKDALPPKKGRSEPFIQFGALMMAAIYLYPKAIALRPNPIFIGLSIGDWHSDHSVTGLVLSGHELSCKVKWGYNNTLVLPNDDGTIVIEGYET